MRRLSSSGVPEATILPRSRTAIRSASWSASSRYWVVRNKVVPSRTRSRSTPQSSTRLRGSSPVVTVSRPGEIEAAAAIVRGEVGEIHVDRDARHITAPAEGVGALTRIAARLDEAGIDLDDIGLQRPSLDDVFLNLTGHRAEVEQEQSHDEQITEAVR